MPIFLIAKGKFSVTNGYFDLPPTHFWEMGGGRVVQKNPFLEILILHPEEWCGWAM